MIFVDFSSYADFESSAGMASTADLSLKDATTSAVVVEDDLGVDDVVGASEDPSTEESCANGTTLGVFEASTFCSSAARERLKMRGRESES